MGRMQRNEYEGLYVICFNYGQYGHQHGNCSNLVPVGDPAPVTTPNLCVADSHDNNSPSRHQHLGEIIGFEPWMILKLFRHPTLPVPSRRQLLGTEKGGFAREIVSLHQLHVRALISRLCPRI